MVVLLSEPETPPRLVKVRSLRVGRSIDLFPPVERSMGERPGSESEQQSILDKHASAKACLTKHCWTGTAAGRSGEASQPRRSLGSRVIPGPVQMNTIRTAASILLLSKPAEKLLRYR